MHLMGLKELARRRAATSAVAITIIATGTFLGFVKQAKAADTTFVLQGVTFTGGGSLTGSFTTNEARTTLLFANITSSANGGFPGFNYLFSSPSSSTMPSNSTAIFGPTALRLTSSNPSGFQLQLSFANNNLGPTGASLVTTGSSSENVQIQGAGNRTITAGSVVATASPVPETSTWVSMSMGTAFMGGMMIRTKRRRK